MELQELHSFGGLRKYQKTQSIKTVVKLSGEKADKTK